MSYQLKTTGIAANCTMCLAVDPDTLTIKDFASPAVTADMLVGANVTIGSQTWDGVTRHYFIPGAGTADADFVKFGANKPRWQFGPAHTTASCVFIGAAAGVTVRVFGVGSADYFSGQNIGSGGNNYPTLINASNVYSGGNAPLSVGVKAIFGFSMTQGVASAAYVATDTATSMTKTTLGNGSGTADWAIGYVNRRTDATSHDRDKTHAILTFDIALTEAQWDSLRDDWFGTLLEASGSSPHSITISNSQQANTASSGAIHQAITSHPITISSSQQVNTASACAISSPIGSDAYIDIPEFRDWGTGNLQPGLTGIQVDVRNIATGALIVRKTGQTSHATTAVCRVTDPLMPHATLCEVVVRHAGKIGIWDLMSV